MSLTAYQQQVDDLQKPFKKPYWSQLSQLARLTEEVGELARALNHKYGDKVKKASEAPDDIAGEMGDILYGLMCLANVEKIDLDEAFQATLRKVTTRDKDRFERK